MDYFNNLITQRVGTLANFARLTDIKAQNVKAIKNPTATTIYKIVDALKLNDAEVMELITYFAKGE